MLTMNTLLHRADSVGGAFWGHGWLVLRGRRLSQSPWREMEFSNEAHSRSSPEVLTGHTEGLTCTCVPSPSPGPTTLTGEMLISHKNWYSWPLKQAVKKRHQCFHFYFLLNCSQICTRASAASLTKCQLTLCFQLGDYPRGMLGCLPHWLGCS